MIPAILRLERLRIGKQAAMPIWVDADACPGDIKSILFKAAQRSSVLLTLVANQKLSVPASPFIQMMIVPGGLDEADKRIEEIVQPADLVITADVPLAAKVVAKGALALNPRGHLYTDVNVGNSLLVRNVLSEMRDQGIVTGGPSALSAKDRQAFANQLDRWLAKAKKQAR